MKITKVNIRPADSIGLGQNERKKMNRENSSRESGDWKNNKMKIDRFRYRTCREILTIYFLAMTAIYPFFAPGGYTRIGEMKYLFFRNASLIMVIALGGIIIATVFIRRNSAWIAECCREMSITDWFAYGYCLTVMLSYLCSEYKEGALWGAKGWYMGAMSQIIFVLIYFFFSRYFCRRRLPDRQRPVKIADHELCDVSFEANDGKFYGLSERKWFYVWLLAAAGVFILGICNRYSVYPIAMEGQTETFISTLGNINWFCGYWSVTAPMGIMFYWGSDRLAVRVLSGIYCFVAMLSGITQGSSSAYLVFMALLFSLFMLSMRSSQRLYRFFELCMLFAIACRVGRFMQYLPGLSYNYQWYQADEGSGITGLLTTGNAAVVFFLIVLSGYVVFHILEKKKDFRIETYRWLWSILAAGVLAVVCITVFFLLSDAGVISFREVPGTAEQDGYLETVLDESWGNGRGAAWKCGIDAYESMDPLHKMIGAGPDCFADYIYDVPELAERMVDRFGTLRLTNAHNEWLTMLVNTGALGLFCYAGMFLAAFVRYLRKGREEPLLYVCAIVLLAYMVHNMVSFQQVLSTPYIFMVLGIGEGLATE